MQCLYIYMKSPQIIITSLGFEFEHGAGGLGLDGQHYKFVLDTHSNKSVEMIFDDVRN